MISVRMFQEIMIWKSIFHMWLEWANIADFNSKIQDGVNPVELTNSQEWRHGNQVFCQDVFPGEDMVFLKYFDGEMTKYTQPKVDQNVLHITCGDDKTNQVTPVTFGHFSVAIAKKLGWKI